MFSEEAFLAHFDVGPLAKVVGKAVEHAASVLKTFDASYDRLAFKNVMEE
jgi:hypothetical protein